MRRVWGMNNREAPLRMCTDSHGEPNNMEYKALDATANPYLALAVLIIAGLEACLFCRLMHVPHPTRNLPVLDVALQCDVLCIVSGQQHKGKILSIIPWLAEHCACTLQLQLVGSSSALYQALSAGHQSASTAARANLCGPRQP